MIPILIFGVSIFLVIMLYGLPYLWENVSASQWYRRRAARRSIVKDLKLVDTFYLDARKEIDRATNLKKWF